MHVKNKPKTSIVVEFISKVFVLLLISGACIAGNIKYEICLTSIAAVQVSEKDGDELYIHTTEYLMNRKPKNKRVPNFPQYWRSQDLHKVKNVPLYYGLLENNRSTSLVISLIEHDIPPFDNDDHLGSVKVSIINKGGKLQAKWMHAEYNDGVEFKVVNKETNTFSLKTSTSEYILQLSLKSTPSR